MSERMDGKTEEMIQPADHPAETAAPRRRRADRYRTETPAESGETGVKNTDQPVLSSGSETAREVANRYRQRQEQSSAEETMRVPSLSERNAAGGRNGREQVGYAPGQMGMNAGQRARMSEMGRARLAEESRSREAGASRQGNGRERIASGNRTADGRPQSRETYGMDSESSRNRNNGYGGRPVIARKEAPRRGKGVLALVIILLVIVALLAAVLLMPEDSSLGSLRTKLTGLIGGQRENANVISFQVSGQDQQEAPANIVFTAVTGKAVKDVRLMDEEGTPLLADEMREEREDALAWELSWYAEEPYDGMIRLQTNQGEAWTDTEAGVRVEVLPRAETAPEELPEVVATEEPAFTPEPTAEPEPAAEEEETADAENEGAGEGLEEEDEPEEVIGAADPDDPGEGWDEPAEEYTAEEPEETGDAESESAAEAEDGEQPDQTAEAEEKPAESAEAEPAEAEPVQAADAEPAEETPERPLMTVTAAESADPSLITTTVVYNGTKKVTEYARADKEKIHMPTLGEYSKVKVGVLTFRSDAFRQNAAVGTVKGADSLEIAWTAEAGSVKGSGQTYYGIGWVGQPAIVKWSKQVREQSEMYDAKKEKTGLKEVIAAGLDGRIYFLDLADGTPTRNSIKLGYPMKASHSVHPGGAPYMTVGQFARKMASGRQGTIGLRQYNLYLQKELSLIDGLDAKNNRPYNKVGSFETSALIDRVTGCMITAGTNGMLYLINLNSEFDFNAGTYTQSPTTVVMKSKAKGEKDASTAVEASIAMYDRYVYYADVGGFLRCVDTNTLTTAWAVALGDTVESTPALDWHGEDGLDLYTATELATRKKGDAEVKCFDALSGEVRWTAAFGVKKDTKNKTVSGFRASPVVGQNGLSGYVYYTVNNLSAEGQEQLGLASETAALIALRKEDGSVAWAAGLSGGGYSSPVAVYDEEGNGAIIQCAGDGSIVMLDGLTGQERASLQLDGAIEASPAVYDGMMVIGTSERNKNNIYGIKIE